MHILVDLGPGTKSYHVYECICCMLCVYIVYILICFLCVSTKMFVGTRIRAVIFFRGGDDGCRGRCCPGDGGRSHWRDSQVSNAIIRPASTSSGLPSGLIRVGSNGSTRRLSMTIVYSMIMRNGSWIGVIRFYQNDE